MENNDKAEKNIVEFLESLNKSASYKRCREYFLQNESALKNFICKNLP
jgi:hypothetical protein